MRVRAKNCHDCDKSSEALYRCRYGTVAGWVFLCGSCLLKIKAAFPDSYHYGGTWKSRKK